MKKNAAGLDLCIYCLASPATEDFSGIGCGCEDTPEYMRASAPVAPAPRCPECGEFAPDCECSSRAHSHDRQFGFGARVVRAGED
jgi:hypothetical protein